MQNLWQNTSIAAWQEALAAYPEVIHAQKVNELEKLDLWHRETLPALLASRQPPFVTLEELTLATRWKMKRGAWRQRNLVLVSGNAPEEVREVSQQAFADVPDPRKPISALSSLAGVGPATASAIMSAHTPSLYPFFDELVAEQIPDLGPVTFTQAYYSRYAQQLRDRAQALSRGNGDNGEWTANSIGQALWASSGGKSATKSADSS